MTKLLSPLRIGNLDLPNRVIMAPMTRSRAGAEGIPNALMANYYRQRAGAGLIITEGVVVSPQGVGYAGTPGIWSAEQVEGWKLVTNAVHDAGGRIFAQLWHVGRISHPIFLDGALPVAPSAIAPSGHVSHVRPETAYVVPRALELEELPGIIEQFRSGAANAEVAGFDGVEIHGANGYLLDQFLQGHSNRRTDDYGGSIANRARLMLEVTYACIGVWGASRVAMHLSPRGDAHDVGDSDLLATFRHVARELGRCGIAFITVREHPGPDRIGPQLKAAFGGVYVANEGFDQASGEAVLVEGSADAVAYGRLFIANPDLPRRFAEDAPLNSPDPQTFYAGGTNGYTDYLALP
ncbi:MAG TPA: alkene reductase [Bryobacteraceae bacterium]